MSFTDAVFNIGRTALLVAALAAGDVEALSVATADRLHQDAGSPPSRVARRPRRRAGRRGLVRLAVGQRAVRRPDVRPGRRRAIAAALPPDGHTKRLRIAPEGRPSVLTDELCPLSGHVQRSRTEAAGEDEGFVGEGAGEGAAGVGWVGRWRGERAGGRAGDADVDEAGPVDHPRHVAAADLESPRDEQLVHLSGPPTAPSSADIRSRAVAASS